MRRLEEASTENPWVEVFITSVTQCFGNYYEKQNNKSQILETLIMFSKNDTMSYRCRKQQTYQIVITD